MHSVERYSIELEEWTYAESLPESLYDHAGTAYQDMVGEIG